MENYIPHLLRCFKYQRYNHHKEGCRGNYACVLLFLATSEEMAAALRKQRFTDYKRITIRKGGEEIQTNTYILTFKKLKIPNEVKIGYYFERMEQYIPHL